MYDRGMWLFLYWDCNGGVVTVTLTTCWSLLIPFPPYSIAKFFSGRSFKKGATLAGLCLSLPEDKHNAPPPPRHKNCCCNHRDTTQTEISLQSRWFKELDLPTKLALSYAELSLKLVRTVFSPVGCVCTVAAAHRSPKRKGWAKKVRGNSCLTKRAALLWDVQ